MPSMFKDYEIPVVLESPGKENTQELVKWDLGQLFMGER